MFFVQPVRLRYVFPIPAVVTALVAADQQNRRAARIESVQDAIRFALVLNPKLTHLTEPRAAHIGAMGKRELRPLGFEQPDAGVDRYLDAFVEPSHQAPNSSVYSISHTTKYNSCII